MAEILAHFLRNIIYGNGEREPSIYSSRIVLKAESVSRETIEGLLLADWSRMRLCYGTKWSIAGHGRQLPNSNWRPNRKGALDPLRKLAVCIADVLERGVNGDCLAFSCSGQRPTSRG